MPDLLMYSGRVQQRVPKTSTSLYVQGKAGEFQADAVCLISLIICPVAISFRS